MSLSYHIRFLSFGTQHEAPDKYETGKADATGTTKRFSNQVRVYPPKKVVVSIGEWSSDHGRGGRFPKVRPADPPILILWLPLRLRNRLPPRKVVPVPHCRSCRHRTEEGIHLVYARGGVWLRAFGFTPQRFRMTDISGQESLAGLNTRTAGQLSGLPSFRKKRRQPAAHQNHRYGRQYTIHRNGHRSAARRRRPRGFPPMGTDAPPEIRMAANRTTRNIWPCRNFVRHRHYGMPGQYPLLKTANQEFSEEAVRVPELSPR